MSAFENLSQIVSPAATLEQRQFAIRGFADDLAWRPSYELRGSFGADDVYDHLIVEHGLENAAAFSFVRSPKQARDLDGAAIRSLLSISYNNLIDWHILVSEFDIRVLNNRSYPDGEQVAPVTDVNIQRYLSGDSFDDLRAAWSFKRSNMACDDALIATLSRWKRILRADVGANADNESISSLFNALIFIRGCEDQANQNVRSGRLLPKAVAQWQGAFDPVRFLQGVLDETGVAGRLDKFVDVERLGVFADLDRPTLGNMVRDFYKIESVPYEFNFALMSKHALSRIYEKYVSILEFDEAEERQLSFFRALPSEQALSRSGAVYTPQYVASFFARYLEYNLPPRVFRALKSIDPACGSGIFLRNLLELQTSPLNPGTTPQTIGAAFEAAEGIDRDANACAATRLSLALLHLVATNRLPDRLNVREADAIKAVLDGGLAEGSYDAVVANPPYVKLDFLTGDERARYSEYLGSSRSGRVDSYLAFVKLSLEAVKPGGFVCLVLPQTFLAATNARPLRNYIRTDFEIRCLVDLSTIEVFEGVGAYTILLIVEKRLEDVRWMGPAQIARVQDGVGAALQACLDRKTALTPYYQVFEVDQEYFLRDPWVLLPPHEFALEKRLEKLPTLGEFMKVNQGFLSGSDKIFVRNRKDVPLKERRIWIDYLTDREMIRYRTPKAVLSTFFFPFVDGEPLDEDRLNREFPDTWAYLLNNRAVLEARQAVGKGEVPWWRPTRPRSPASLLRPKIVCPHLMLTPRFGIDEQGRFAVSHGPFVSLPDERAGEVALLKFFCAVLNSSVVQWYVSAHSPKYGKAYNRIEVALLRNVPVPDPAALRPADLNAVVGLVDRILETGESQAEREVNELVQSLYQLDSNDLAFLGESY